MTAAPAIRQKQAPPPARRWEAVYRSPLLTGRTEPEIADALETVEPRQPRGWRIWEIAEAVRDELDERDRRAADASLPRSYGLTAAEHASIAAVQKKLCEDRIRRNQAEVQDFIEFAIHEAVLRSWEDVYQAQQRTIRALLDYIANTPAPSEVGRS